MFYQLTSLYISIYNKKDRYNPASGIIFTLGINYLNSVGINASTSPITNAASKLPINDTDR